MTRVRCEEFYLGLPWNTLTMQSFIFLIRNTLWVVSALLILATMVLLASLAICIGI